MGLRGELRREFNGWLLRRGYSNWVRRGQGGTSAGRLSSLKNLYAGRRCFVVGNGPSLLKCDLSKLADEITIVSNAHFLIWDKLNYLPTFLTVEDKLVAEDRAEDLLRLQGVTQVYPFGLRKILRDDRASTTYCNFIWDYRGFPKFSHDFQNIVYWGGTVSYLNLQLARYLGCTEIYMIGFDHNYQVPSKDRIINSVIASQEADVNHIHPDYFGPGYRWHDPNVARMEVGYLHAKSELERVGVKVMNATIGGHLEVFPRVDYDSLF